MKRWAVTFFASLGALYFAAHALAGERGVLAWTGVRADIVSLEAELTSLDGEIVRLEDRARRLRIESLDLDYLEERARALLSVGRPGEVVIPASALPERLSFGAVDAAGWRF